MARRHYWQFLVTDEGTPIENANISIYIAGTTDPAFVYFDEVSATGSNVAPQTVTSKKGYFEFWVADSTETNGYSYDTKFKLAWAAVGVQSGHIDYVDVFSTSVAQVDETDVDTTKNKAVSNFLAKGWEDHKNSVLFVNSITSIHGITFVDETQLDDSVPENTKLNKLVSNSLANNWEGHVGTTYDPTNDAWYFSIAGSPPALADGASGRPGNPHGIDFVDTSSSDSEKNRLISNFLGKQWHDHRTNQTSGNTDHPQFSLIDGTRAFTGVVSGITPTANAHLATKGYVDGRSYSSSIPVGSWVLSGGLYSYTVSHNLGDSYPCVALWDVFAAELVQPESVVVINVNTILVKVTAPFQAYIKVVK